MTVARIALPWRARPRRPRAARRTLARPGRRGTVFAALAAVVLAAGWYWGRDLSLWAVRDVRVQGASGPDAARVEAALREAARGQTTLHVREGALRDAVARFPVVRALRVHADFPRGLRIEVVENVPVAALVAAGRPVAVAADGTLLRDRPVTGLPQVPARLLPGGAHVTDRQALGAVALAGAAPASFRPVLVRVRSGGRDGLRADLQGGLRIVFGSRTRLRAKWAAALRVLSDPRAAGASYLDVRSPERPVAGGRFTQGLPGAGAAASGPATPADIAPTATAPADTTASAPDPATPANAGPESPN